MGGGVIAKNARHSSFGKSGKKAHSKQLASDQMQYLMNPLRVDKPESNRPPQCTGNSLKGFQQHIHSLIQHKPLNGVLLLRRQIACG